MKKKATKEANSTLSTTPQVTRQGDVESLVKSSTVHSNQIQSIEKGLVDDPFIHEMIAYEKASNG
jgi:type II secretory pathway component HofQ